MYNKWAEVKSLQKFLAEAKVLSCESSISAITWELTLTEITALNKNLKISLTV